MKCKHWKSCGITNGGCCGLHLYGGEPSLSVCIKICPSREADADTLEAIPLPAISKGLGDTIAKLTHTVGIAQIVEAFSQATGVDCGCGKRQAALNKLVSYSESK